MLAKPRKTQSGFADHYPVFKWLFHWEDEPNIFRQTHLMVKTHGFPVKIFL